MVEDEIFAKLLARLRSARGLSQARLAQMAAVSNATVHRAEDADGKVPSARIAIALFSALNDSALVSVSDLMQYAKLAGVDASALDPRGRVQSLRTVAEGFAPQIHALTSQSRVWSKAIDELPVQYRLPILRTMELVDEVGEDRTIAFLRLAEVAAGLARPEEQSTIDVKHPPREVDLKGTKAVEQVTTTYEKPRKATSRHAGEADARKSRRA